MRITICTGSRHTRLVGCRARRCRADVIEAAVLAAIADGVLSRSVIDAARAELRRRLDGPAGVQTGRQRARLQTRLERLKAQHGWGDLSDEEYRAKRDATRAALAELPDGDRIVAFDAYRARLLELPEAIAAAGPARREELCRIVIERVVVRDREVETISWTAPVRPFFEPGLKRQRECPQGCLGSGHR